MISKQMADNYWFNGVDGQYQEGFYALTSQDIKDQTEQLSTQSTLIFAFEIQLAESREVGGIVCLWQ